MAKLTNAECDFYIKSKEEIVLKLSGISSQHYYPHSIVDYAEAIKKYIKGATQHLPIMAIDCHDCYPCDFKCKDCLADETKEWFKINLNVFKNAELEFEKYKKALRKIAAYSAECGINNVRFEMSGEGNPDLYPYRKEIIMYAKEELGMQPVYISSGSKIDSELLEILVKYAAYIRISLPGITNEEYIKYSGQNKFIFDDAVYLLKRMVYLRKEYKREKDLLIGVRTCLRPEIVTNIEYITRLLLKEIGVDTFQIVRPIINVNENIGFQNIAVPFELKQILKNIKDKYGVIVPDNMNYYYNERVNVNTMPKRCFASELMPILYNSYLLPCTHTRMIKNTKYYKDGELSVNSIPHFEVSPLYCRTCCAIKDNYIFEKIYVKTKELIEKGEEPIYTMMEKGF